MYMMGLAARDGFVDWSFWTDIVKSVLAFGLLVYSSVLMVGSVVWPGFVSLHFTYMKEFL